MTPFEQQLERIQSSFEKGTYENTYENRKLGRVGQKYGGDGRSMSDEGGKKIAEEFQAKLEALQTETKELINSGNRRKKVVRQRIKELTEEFYATKKEWRETLGPTGP